MAAVVVAAGSGSRFGAGGPPKQFRDLLGRPLLEWSLRLFLDHPRVEHTVVVLPPASVDEPPDWLARLPVARVPGGAERGDSVRRGISSLDPAIDIVLVHDGARPLVTAGLVDRLLDAAVSSAVIPGLPVTDTLKEVGEGRRITATVDRSRLWRVQTPQAFPLAILRRCHERAAAEGYSATDDAALLERYGEEVRVIEGDADNIKVTTPPDFALAEHLAQRLPSPPARTAGAGPAVARTVDG